MTPRHCEETALWSTKQSILFESGQSVVVGLSGGPDSVCLLYELLPLGNPIICAHVNHGLRGQESDADETYVRALCEKLNVPLEVKRIDAAALAKETGKTIEEAGREARYAFFDELCGQQDGAPTIAVAHNRDDQVETVLMRVLRGTGVDGLAGMAPSRKSEAGYDIVRPLLNVSREEIMRRLKEHGEEARLDTSNLNTDYFRNKIRLEIIPFLEKTTDFSLPQSLLRLAENAAEDKSYFDTVVAGTLDEYVSTVGEATCFPAEVLAEVHPAIRHRLIRAVFAEIGLKKDIAAVHLAAADRLLTTWQEGGEASGKRVEFPADYTFGINGKDAVFRTPEAASKDWKPRRKHDKIYGFDRKEEI